MKTIYLVRHAETTWNLEGKVQGSQDTQLSMDGLAQTVKTVAFLSALRFDTILTSPLARARAIAEPVGVTWAFCPSSCLSCERSSLEAGKDTTGMR